MRGRGGLHAWEGLLSNGDDTGMWRKGGFWRNLRQSGAMLLLSSVLLRGVGSCSWGKLGGIRNNIENGLYSERDRACDSMGGMSAGSVV